MRLVGTYIGTSLTQKLSGGSGDDIVKDEKGGNDTLLGNGGDDILTVTRTSAMGATTVHMDAGTGDDELRFNGGGLSSGTLIGGDGYNEFNVSNAKHVTLTGGGKDDEMNLTGVGGATINAGAGRDQINVDLRGASSGEYVVTMGTGADVLDIRYTDRAIRVTDFTSDDPGVGDLIDLTTYLAEQLTGWDMSTNPFVTGHLGLIQRGDDVVLRVDTNGGGDSWKDLVILEDRTLASFEYDDRGLSGYAPDLSAPDNLTKTGGSGNDQIEGRSGDDKLYGKSGNDTITGSYGNDTLDGSSGRDTLDGGAGDDRILGGSSNDVLIGSYGNDTFVFGRRGGSDVINDFEAGGAEDRLDFSALKSAGVTWKIAQVGDDTVISFSDGGKVTLLDVDRSDLVTSGSFIY